MQIPSALLSLFITTLPLQEDLTDPVNTHLTFQEPMTIEYHPIGAFITELSPETGAPRQGALTPENRGIIRIHQAYKEALTDLESCSHIIVLYHMHLSKKWSSSVRPPGSENAMGLFATRSPNRPNSIGFSVIKLDSINGLDIHVSGVDAFNETPVLDIKPWIPSLDCPEAGDQSSFEKKVGLTH